MKYIAVFAVFLGLVPSLQSQSVDKAEIKVTTEALADHYQLTEAQQEEAYKIAERRLRNQAEIAHLQSSDHKLYLQKKNGIREGEIISLCRLLNEDQLPILQAEMVERRKKESALIKEMKSQGATREEIQLAVWDME